uniref:Uncharacterized protein n=1 Tax=Anguilla anguilla TaxID=7936 RepID=A0A0E9XFQ0_ANGAN
MAHHCLVRSLSFEGNFQTASFVGETARKNFDGGDHSNHRKKNLGCGDHGNHLKKSDRNLSCP